MKLFLFIFTALTVCAFAWAQDPGKAASHQYKQIFENERVRVFDITIKAGESVATHSHPDHMAYAMTDCTLTMTGSDGKAQNASLKKGEVLWSNATTHSAVNSGKTDCLVVVVELKEPKPAAK